MGEIGAETGIVRVLGVVEGIEERWWVVRSVKADQMFKFRVETVTGEGMDSRLGDKGQFVDVEAVKSSSGDYIVRQVAVVEGTVDFQTISQLIANI